MEAIIKKFMDISKENGFSFDIMKFGLMTSIEQWIDDCKY